MLSLVGAYAYEELGRLLLRKSEPRAHGPIIFLILLLVVAAVLATPYGVKLLRIPFQTNLDYEAQYIVELRRPGPRDLFSAEVFLLRPSLQMVINTVLFFAWLAFLTSIQRGRLRLSHVVLATMGSLLLFKGVRFIGDCALLCLPILRDNPPVSLHDVGRLVARPIRVFCISILSVMPVMFIEGYLGNPPHYPFTRSRLPHGIVTFLQTVGAHGKLLSSPNSGGYLQWALYPRYRILSDMEVPFLFTTSDFQMSKDVFDDRQLFGRLLHQYHPEFLGVPYDASKVPGWLADFPQYTLVFLDDVQMLYMDREQFPLFAKWYGMANVDPVALVGETGKTLVATTDTAPVFSYLPRLLAIDAGCELTNRFAAQLMLKQGVYDRALPYAQAIIDNYPELASGYYLKADALVGLHLLDRAIPLYGQALRFATADERPEIARKIGHTWLEKGVPKRAYAVLNDYINIYGSKTTSEALYELASAAARTGKRKEASMILQYLYTVKLKPEETALRQRVERDAQQFGLRLPKSSRGAS